VERNVLEVATAVRARARTARPVTVPVPLPVASANCPVPPTICPVWWIAAVTTKATVWRRYGNAEEI
jgi:hypothetical protein